MQRKHLIAFTLATILLLLGFNMINVNKHEKNKTAQVASQTAVVPESNTEFDANGAEANSNNPNSSAAIAAQPLAEHPTAVINNVSADSEQAQ